MVRVTYRVDYQISGQIQWIEVGTFKVKMRNPPPLSSMISMPSMVGLSPEANVTMRITRIH